MTITVKAFPWDLGQRTDAQIAGKIVEEVVHVDPVTGRKSNPNQVIRARYETHVIRYRKAGKLTDVQALIALELLEAHLGMTAQDPLAAVKIDRAMGLHEPAIALVDARAKFRRMRMAIPNASWPVIEHVVLNDLPARTMGGDTSSKGEARRLALLRVGLNALAMAWR